MDIFMTYFNIRLMIQLSLSLSLSISILNNYKRKGDELLTRMKRTLFTMVNMRT